MTLVSATRLRLKSPRHLLPFFWYVFNAARQTATTPGFMGGKIFWDAHFVFWTSTVWQDCRSMRTYQGSGGHRRAMPQLVKWCDEASVVHWQQETAELPGWLEAHRRMLKEGRFTPLPAPSIAQLAHQIQSPRPALWRDSLTTVMALVAGLRKSPSTLRPFFGQNAVQAPELVKSVDTPHG